jgi:hypothetical protein
MEHYAHLFIEDGQEGEPIATFHISKTTDLAPTLGLILIPHHSASQSLGRLEQTMTTHRETLLQVTMEPTKPPMEEGQLTRSEHMGMLGSMVSNQRDP